MAIFKELDTGEIIHDCPDIYNGDPRYEQIVPKSSNEAVKPKHQKKRKPADMRNSSITSAQKQVSDQVLQPEKPGVSTSVTEDNPFGQAENAESSVTRQPEPNPVVIIPDTAYNVRKILDSETGLELCRTGIVVAVKPGKVDVIEDRGAYDSLDMTYPWEMFASGGTPSLKISIVESASQRPLIRSGGYGVFDQTAKALKRRAVMQTAG